MDLVVRQGKEWLHEAYDAHAGNAAWPCAACGYATGGVDGRLAVKRAAAAPMHKAYVDR